MALDSTTLAKLAKVELTVMQPHPDAPKSALPLFLSKVTAGLPAQVDDTVHDYVDLNDYCLPHPESSFLLRVSGQSMLGAGIHDGDLLVVDRSSKPKSGQVVIAALDGEFTVKRLARQGQAVQLVAENPEYPSIKVRPDQMFMIWGVVTFVVHRL
ncbi:LexA family protein [Acidithiobacillus ferrivorans]|nr:LexA family transcriptional regulator [Acidithiobacillus ferrivorans]